MAWDWETGLQEYPGASDPEAARVFLHAMQAVPYTAAGLLAPQVALGGETNNPYNWIPGKGLATGVYASATGLAELASNYVGKPAAQFMQRLSPNFASVTPTIPDDFRAEIPGSETAVASTKESVNRAFTSLPHVEATTPGGRLGEEIGKGLTQGAMTVLPPGVGMLPKALSVPLGLLVPAAKTAPIGAAIGGTLGTISGALAEDAMPPPFEPYDPNKKKEEAPPIFTPYAPPAAAAPPVLPPPTSDNDSGTSYLVRGLEAAAAATIAWGVSRYGPRGINVLSDLFRGQTRSALEANTILSRGLPGAQNIDMPLPNDASGLTRQWATRGLNPNAVVNEFVKAPEVSATPEIAAIKKAANDAVNNPANSNRRMESLFRTGVEEGSGHNFPKIVDFKRGVEALNPVQREAFSDAAWFKNELNNRYANMRNGLPEPDARVSYSQWDTAALRQRVAQAEADPQVKALLDLKKQFTDSVVDSAETRGHITTAEANHARNVYPDFMPTIDSEGKYMQSWEGRIREPRSGHSEHPAEAWQALINHFDRSIRSMQRNEWQRSLILDWKKAQDADPTLPQFIKEVDASSVGDRRIAIRTDAGERYFNIYNTPFYDNLITNPQSMNLASSIANTMRSFYTNATTGVLNAALGAPYAATNLLIDTALVPAQAGKGMWRGSLDRAFNTRLPYDPTFPINVGQTLLKDTGSVGLKNLADILGNRNNALSKTLRSAFGHDAVDAWSKWMQHQFELTNLGFRESQGVSGGGNRAMVDLRSPVTDKAGTYRDPTTDAVSPLLNMPNIDKVMQKVPLPNFLRETVGGMVKSDAESFINLYTLLKDLYAVANDAPHSALFDLNKTNQRFTPRTLANEVQNVTGDPGTHGIGGATRAAARGIPWYNTSVQGMAAHLRAVRDRPIATGMTMASVLLTYSLASHLSALVSGPEHVKHFEDKVTNSTKARSHVFYHGPGTDPNEHSELPTPPEWRIWAPYVDGLVGHAVGTWNAFSDSDFLARLIHTLSGPFDQHVTTDTDIQTAIGGMSGFMPLDVPPIIGAPMAALTGQEVRNLPETFATNVLIGEPWLSGMTTGGGFKHSAPGQEGTDGILTRSDAGTFKAIMSSLGAAVGTAYDMANNFSHRMKMDPNWEWAWRGLGEDYKQHWQDSTKFLNSVWQNSLPQSTFGSLEERTNRMYRNVQETANYNTDVRGEGQTQMRRGTPITVTADSPVPKDPAMRELYQTTSETAKFINKEIMPRENEIRAQMANLRNDTFLPEERRRIQNKLSEELYQITTQKHQILLDLNARLSKMTGGRHVDLGHQPNWQGTIEQFHY